MKIIRFLRIPVDVLRLRRTMAESLAAKVPVYPRTHGMETSISELILSHLRLCAGVKKKKIPVSCSVQQIK